AWLATMIVRAVMVQTMTVSMKGSSRATKPSEIGRRVLTAEWAIGAEPIPASLEKAERWKPMIMTPMTPPAMPCGLNAPEKISPTAWGVVERSEERRG